MSVHQLLCNGVTCDKNARCIEDSTCQCIDGFQGDGLLCKGEMMEAKTSIKTFLIFQIYHCPSKSNTCSTHQSYNCDNLTCLAIK